MKKAPLILGGAVTIIFAMLQPVPAPAAILIVTNLAASGPGSLQNVITAAAANDTITFAVKGTITNDNGFVLARNLNITGPGATNLTLYGDHSMTVMTVNAGVTGSISGLTISGGYNTFGGGIYNLGNLSITACQVLTNSCFNSGGGIYNSGTLTARSSVVVGNIGTGGGGGIYSDGVVTLTSCTVCGNIAGGSSTIGGGVWNDGGTLALISCTVSGNQVPLDGGGIAGPCTLRSTLIAQNTLLSASAPANDVMGSVTSLGHNLIGFNGGGGPGITNGVNHDIVGTNPPIDARLLPLANYSGPFPTVALQADSPAVDAGDDALLSAPFNLTTDERGVARKFGSHVDIGTFEFIAGDFNNDGVVDQSERDRVLANYFPNTPWLLLTNVAGLGGTNVIFALTNSTAGTYNAEYSTNLSNWISLGPATPRYLFTDTNAPSVPKRYYRLRLQ